MNNQGRYIALTEKNTLKIMENSIPDVKENGMLLGIGLAGVCGTDIHIIENADSKEYKGILPMGLGHEVTGTVLKIGKRFQDNIHYHGPLLKEGDRVVLYAALPCNKCWWDDEYGVNHTLICDNPLPGYFASCDQWPYFVAGWGDYMYIQPNSWIYKIPDNLCFEEAVLTEPFSMGMRAVEKALSLPGWKDIQRVMFDGVAVVIGSGAIGILTSIALKIIGTGKVILIGGPSNLLNFIKTNGFADEVIDVFQTSHDERIELINGMSSSGKGADVVFEAVGIPEMFIESLEMVRKLGTVVELGCLIDSGKEVKINVAKHIVSKDITIYGVVSQSPQYLGRSLRAISNFHKIFDFKKLVTHKYEIFEMEQMMKDIKKTNELKIKSVFKGKGYYQS